MTNKDLFEFIKKSPTAFHAVKTIADMLEAKGFTALEEGSVWKLTSGHNYYVTRNDSSIIAFKYKKVTEKEGFRICASHCDSPAFKLKENSLLTVKSKYIQLNTEGYGGMICYSWMDRPLSLAGRVIIKEDGKLTTRLVNIDRDLVIIPSLAIHMNRKANEGVEFNKQIDMLPLLGSCGEKEFDVKELIADELGVSKEAIYGQDIFVYNRDNGTSFGLNSEYISAPRLDDLMCAYASLEGFIQSDVDENISVYACFDNEEVGSSTRQGAASSFFEDTLERIGNSLGCTKEEYHCLLANSFMLSEDNGHAVHPNHPEKSDAGNSIYMNEGIVVKSHAGQKYSSDAVGVAVCRDICEQNDIPIQFFSNRSDEAGGSTLGNIAACRVPVRTVDIGLAQLAMHSAYETAGAFDCDYMKKFSEAFYGYKI